jgi:hypothetical protein
VSLGKKHRRLRKMSEPGGTPSEPVSQECGLDRGCETLSSLTSILGIILAYQTASV